MELTLSQALTWLFIAVDVALRLLALVVVPYNRKPASAIAWLLIIMIQPIAGWIIFGLLGNNRLPRTRRNKMAAIQKLIGETTLEVADAEETPGRPAWLPGVVELNRQLSSCREHRVNPGLSSNCHRGAIPHHMVTASRGWKAEGERRSGSQDTCRPHNRVPDAGDVTMSTPTARRSTRTPRPWTWSSTFAAVVLLVVVFLVLLAQGTVDIPIDDVVHILLGGDVARPVYRTIVIDARLP